jgi:hypothetical protein
MDATGKKIHPFIFNWVGHYDRTIKLEAEFLKIFEKVTVINSDEKNQEDRWVNISEDAYFTEQFINAINIFDGDIMLHVQADASSDQWKEIVFSALVLNYKYDWGIYAPNVDYTTYIPENVDLKDIEKGVKNVLFTDCTTWFLDRSVIEEFKNYLHVFGKTKYGWGVCRIASSISLKLKKPILRDYRYTIDHPKNTNYNTDKALEEFNILNNDLFHTDLWPFSLKLLKKLIKNINKHKNV